MPRHLLIPALMGIALASAISAAQMDNTSANEKDFIEFAGETDLTASLLGQMAETRGASQTVREFGRTVKQEHDDDLLRLTAVANKVGAVAPNSLDLPHKATADKLAKLKGKAFDRQFLKDVVTDHENVIVSYQRESEHGYNPDLKAYATETLPHLQSHLKQAQRLGASVK